MQPIHTAASSGQLEVIVELIQNLGVAPKEKADVWLVLHSFTIHYSFRKVCKHCTMLHVVVDWRYSSSSLKFTIFHLILQQMYKWWINRTFSFIVTFLGGCLSTAFCFPFWIYWCGRGTAAAWGWSNPDIWCKNNSMATVRVCSYSTNAAPFYTM